MTARKKKKGYSTKGRTGRRTTPNPKTKPADKTAQASEPAPVLAAPGAKPIELGKKTDEPESSPDLGPEPTESKPDPGPEPKAKKVRSKFTLDQAVEWFEKDPHPEEFFCTGPAGLAIAHGNHYLQFVKGKFMTSDPAEVKILMGLREYNQSIFAMNPVLRNLKK